MNMQKDLAKQKDSGVAIPESFVAIFAGAF